MAKLYVGESAVNKFSFLFDSDYSQAWLQTICREYRRRTVAIRSRSSADCTTAVWR